MKRTEFIEQLAEFLKTFPEGCSDYHICDMLISKAEKMGMLSPIHDLCNDEMLDPKEAKRMFEQAWDDCLVQWEPEEDEDYL